MVASLMKHKHDTGKESLRYNRCHSGASCQTVLPGELPTGQPPCVLASSLATLKPGEHRPPRNPQARTASASPPRSFQCHSAYAPRPVLHAHTHTHTHTHTHPVCPSRSSSHNNLKVTRVTTFTHYPKIWLPCCYIPEDSQLYLFVCFLGQFIHLRGLESSPQ